MKVYLSTLSIEGAKLEGENPLPAFRSRNHHRDVMENGSFTPELKADLGYETGERYLPYRIQDRYTRRKEKLALKAIILENDIMRAVFLPEYGGRLYSLSDKRTGREVLYRNSVFQPANLAILNAWFSGGIEWNLGQYGHAFTTCSPVHAMKLSDDKGNEFLRTHEYERCKNFFWQIDFHLPEGSDQLLVHVRITNDSPSEIPMYCWINMAVDETKGTRVFSSTSEVVHDDHEINGFGVHDLPYLPSYPDIDASYPSRIPFSSEYFFQTRESCKAPWSAAAYEDGRLFYERSTFLLRYRKMFCWGNHEGGRHWCDYLARPGEGDYLEMQGGFAPTQLHGIRMPGASTWEFTQVIGAAQVDLEIPHKEAWNSARDYVLQNIEEHMSEERIYELDASLQALADMKSGTVLHMGSGWGALERLRRQKMRDGVVAGESVAPDKQAGSLSVDFNPSEAAPEGMPGYSVSLDGNSVEPQYPWLVLLLKGYFPDSNVNEIPLSWMVQEEWLKMLEESLKVPANRTWTAYMHLGVMLYEKGEEDKAIEAWEISTSIKPSPWVYRNLAVAMKRKNQNDKAISYLESACLLSNGFPDKALAEEYLDLLMAGHEHEKAWHAYESLPREYRSGERIMLMLGKAALELGKNDFMQALFHTEFAVIREGELLVGDLWNRYHANLLSKERNVEMTEDLIMEAMMTFPLPRNLDFGMHGG